MSQWRGRIEEIEEPGDVVEFVGEYYQIPTVVALLVFMLWSRVRKWEQFIVDGTVFFSGNDAWYHYRMVSYTVRHWPQTSPFDTWTYFPYGSHSSQFGTVMDQLVATAALVVGLGSPSDHTIRMVALFAPAIFGTAAAIPVYFIGKRSANRFAGVVAVTVLAFAPTAFVSRSTVGFYDHHAAEVLFQTMAILATMVAVSVAEEEKPVWELFEERNAVALRRTVGWALIAGAAIATYVWVWPPGVFLIGILGVFYLIELSSEYAHGESPEHVAIVGAISLGTAGILSLASLESTGVSSTSFSLLQPGIALAVAGGCAFMAWLAREWDAREFARLQYPAAVSGIILVLAGAFWLLLPDLFSYFVDQVLRVIGLDVTATARTIGEAQPMDPNRLYPKYKFTVFIAIFGAGWLFAKHLWDRPRAELTLLALWLVFMLLAALTQRRFDYYLAVTVAVMTGLVVGQFVDFANLFEFEGDIETYQLLTILAIVMVVFAPILWPITMDNPGEQTVMSATDARPGTAPQAWNESLGWMQSNTPEEGNFAGAGNDMPYYGTFERTEDFEYEDGFYGVISWWDYGHWITTMGERIPNANPFQQGSDEAANFLLSGSEQQANEVLDRMADGENAQTRYVMVDWKMVSADSFSLLPGGGAQRLGGKYNAPFQFYSDGNISVNDYAPRLRYQTQQSFNLIHRHTQNYYNSTVVRLYKFHGSAVEPTPIVFDWEFESVQGNTFPVSNGTQRFRTMEAARNYVANDSTSQIGGFGPYPEERVPAMENYRLVKASERSAQNSPRYLLTLQKYARGVLEQPLTTRTGGINPRVINRFHKTHPSWVKVFERVPGATIEGQGPPNQTVVASVGMRVPASNTTFVYRQQAQTDDDGEFTITVPYSTTEYEEWSVEEGYTNPSVRATGPYEITTRASFNESGYVLQDAGRVNVTEGQVLGVDDSPANVTLEEEVIQAPPENQTASGNETEGDGSTSSEGESTQDDQSTDSPSENDASTDGRDSEAVSPPSETVDPATTPSVGAPGLVGFVAFSQGK